MPTATAPLSGIPQFDIAYVISDLHLGGPPGRQMFSSSEQFVSFIDHVLASLSDKSKSISPARCLLVVNGDFVDFLAEAEARVFNLTRASDMLDRIAADPAFAAVFEKLKEFVKKSGTELVITLGNHDLELALPETRTRLTEILTGGDTARASKVTYCFDGWGYRFRVGNRQALCLHGNETDEYNFTRYDELDRVVRELYFHGGSDFGMSWEPSAGSWFVIHAVNPVKEDLPFVDLLKPEFPVMATVLAVLDPTKASYLREFASMKYAAHRNQRVRPESQRRMLELSLGGGLAQPRVPRSIREGASTNEQIEEMVERALAERRIEELIHAPVDRELLGFDEWVRAVGSAVDSLKGTAAEWGRQATGSVREISESAHCESLRRLLRGIVSDAPAKTDVLDSIDRAIDMCARAAYDVVFAGHTHQRRLAPRTSGKGLYVNTGTWAGLMSFTRSRIESPGFIDDFRALNARSREALFARQLIREECTIARMSQNTNGTVSVSLGEVKQDGATFRVDFPKDRASRLPK